MAHLWRSGVSVAWRNGGGGENIVIEQRRRQWREATSPALHYAEAAKISAGGGESGGINNQWQSK